MSTERAWGQDVDETAGKQLGLDETHTIFMMSSEVDYIDDVYSVVNDFDGVCSAEEVADAIQEKIEIASLPPGFRLVGMCPLGACKPCKYGVVNLTSHGFK